MRQTVRLFENYDPDVIGLQEFQRTQADAFKAMAGSQYVVNHPPGESPENSIAWRRSRWDAVAADSVRIPYFEGRIKRMPAVRLRDRATHLDSIFVNVHNPASTRIHPRQAPHRAEAIRREVALMRMLRDRYGLPVFLTGFGIRRTRFTDHLTVRVGTVRYASDHPVVLSLVVSTPRN